MFLTKPTVDGGPWWLAPGALADLADCDVAGWSLRPGDPWVLTAPRAVLDRLSSALAQPVRWQGLSPSELDLALLGPQRLPRLTWRERLRRWLGLPPAGAAWFDRWSIAVTSDVDRRWASALARSIERDAPVLVLDRVVTQISPKLAVRLGADLQRLVAETGLTLLVLEEFAPEAWPVASRFAAVRHGRLAVESRPTVQG